MTPTTIRTRPATTIDTAVRYGQVLDPSQLRPQRFPSPRGTLTAYLAEHLTRPPHTLRHWPVPDDDVLSGEDGALALYCLYELHYRGFADVDDGWEWEPSLLTLRAELEAEFEPLVGAQVAYDTAAAPLDDQPNDHADVAEALKQIITRNGPSLSRYLADDGSIGQFREFAVHRSIYQLKEADPHTWAIPRLTGPAKAALVEIQMDEYGAGVQRDMHQMLFTLTLRALGLDPSYGAYLDSVPGATLATVNLPTFFGLHRRLRGALVGHLAVLEMTSVEPMAGAVAALRRLGLGAAARHFYEVHVVADAHHESVAADLLATGLVRGEPETLGGVLFGARAAMAVEGQWSSTVRSAWDLGRSSLIDGDVLAAHG